VTEIRRQASRSAKRGAAVVSPKKKAEQAFYRGHEDLESVFAAAARACSNGLIVYGAFYPVGCAASALLRYLEEARAQDWGLSSTGRLPGLVKYGCRVSRQDGGPPFFPKAVMWEEAGQSVIGLLSCQPHDGFDTLRKRLRQYLFPDLYQAYLRTSEVLRGLHRLADQLSGYSIRVREYVWRSLIDDPDSVKRVRTDRQWTDEDYTTVFDKLVQDRAWLSSLKLELRGPERAVGKIWRDGSFACRAGFSLFARSVLPSLRIAVVGSRDFFQQRDRTTSPTGRPRPVRIEYSNPVFSDKRQNHRLLRVLGKLRDSGLSVFHPNPYVRASVVDYQDGSSYDIWVTTDTGILIIPKRRASAASMERLCDHICDEFEEGNVKEFVGRC
jgi:hypothetical protein